MNTNTSGAALIADGTNFNPVVISGDIAIATGGAATIQATSVEGSMLNNNVISGQTEITSGLADADELLYSDAGVLKKVGMDTAKSFFHSSTATAITVADESSDTTCFPVFVTAATGDLGPKSAAGLTFNSSTDVLSGTFAGNITGNVTGNTSGSSGSCTGTAAIATAVTITDNESTNEDNAVIFTSGGDVDGGNIGLESDGTCTYNPSTGKITATGFIGALTGNASGSSGSCTGLSATATALASARTIGGVSFDGTGNINLPGVNSAGNQATSGLAATATLAATTTALASARTIGGVSFDGTGNINLPGVNAAGNQNTSGTAAIATAVTITDNESTNEDNAIIFTSGGDVDGGNIGLESDGTCTYNPSTGKITATGFIGALTGEASVIADSTVTSAKLSGALVTPSSLDVNGNELILDLDADTSITADTDDQIDFKIAGVEHISLTNSSGDTVIKPRVDAKDIIFQQFDGTSILEINDGAYARFTAAGIVPEATLTDASTVTWNALTQSVAKITLGANRDMGLASGGVSGAFISLLVIQDGTGSRTLSWNADYEFTGDAAPTLTTTADKGDLFIFRYNGAKWLETGRNLNLTLS